ncbi:hypothetical protein D0Y60_09800 [Shinella sp. WSJ-2]|nr:hypothetical protein D0Y60_09800 [Shinella sp. WSJ-2]
MHEARTVHIAEDRADIVPGERMALAHIAGTDQSDAKRFHDASSFAEFRYVPAEELLYLAARAPLAPSIAGKIWNENYLFP